MPRDGIRVALFVLLIASIGAGLPAGQEPPDAGGAGVPASGSAAGIAGTVGGPPALVENPLGDVPPDDPRMEAYSHGNYVLFLIDFLWTAAVLAAVVFTGFGATLREWAGRAARGPSMRVAVYAALFAVLMFLAGLPLAIYRGYAREKTYGFANQTFVAWMGDQVKGLLVGVILQAIFFVVLYAALRRLGRRWWIAGAGLSVVFAIVVLAVAPVFIAPLFNKFTPLKDATLRAEILEMAHRQGIPADEVYEMDASRQSSHNNAYVAGLLGTERVVLYDTILKTFAPREIKVVMGHEMGHYVLNHIWKFVAFLSGLIVLGFLVVDRVSRRVIERRPRAGIASLSDPASMPLIVLVLAVFQFLAQPVFLSFSRFQEQQADAFGLEVTGDPEAAASAFLKFGKADLGEYHVHPVIEALLYSHPSLARRVRFAQEYARKRGIVEGTVSGGR